MNTLRRLLVSVVLLGAISCTWSTGPATPDLTGTILEITPRGLKTSVMILEDDAMPGDDGRAIVNISGSTVLRLRAGDATDPPAFGVGSRIRVRTTGVQMRSLPAQYDAVWVEILTRT